MEHNCDKWFWLCLALVFVILAGLVMVFKYFLRLSKDGVKLGQNDKIHEEKHSRNEERIRQLETLIASLFKEKNGEELKKIEVLQSEVNGLKKVIESLKKNK